MKLSNLDCKNAKPTEKPRKMADGGGLYLEVAPNGSKYWRMKYRFNGKESRLSFGLYPDVSLAEAREKRRLAKKTLDEGKNPNEEKRIEKLERQVSYENNFENIAREWHKEKYHTWKPLHAERILTRLEKDVFPSLGARSIKAIKPIEILAAIRGVEDRGAHDLAHRTMQTCSQIFRYGVATGRVERDPTVDLRGALKPVKSENYAYLTEEDLPPFLKKLECYDSHYNGQPLTKLAFKLLLLTFVRSGEIRGALWKEIDWDKAQWKIPAERMKMKEPHIVPLSKQSVALLKEIQKITGDSYGGFLFPSQQNPRKIMSENTFLRVLEILGYKGKATAHGFRSTASTILNENGFRSDVIERQLAHGERDQVRAAYNYAQYLPERKEMMNWWANYIDSVAIHNKRRVSKLKQSS
ncbi:MAG: tyrosine-type recombinase/integrase [Rickettsiales bacterium]|nr:tyrosine-type recombinase/integrase [Rickettsiales bacterium]